MKCCDLLNRCPLQYVNTTFNNLESFFDDKKESYDIFTLKTRFVPAGQKFFSGIDVFHFGVTLSHQSKKCVVKNLL